MKKQILFLLFKKVQQNPSLYKKLKISLAIGAFSFVFVSGLVIWAGVSLVRGGVETVSKIEVPGEIQLQIDPLKTKSLQSVTGQVLNCVYSLENNLSLQALASHSLESLIALIQLECLSPDPTSPKEGIEPQKRDEDYI